MVTLEEILDKIAESLIQSEFVNSDLVEQNQKTIKNGLISLGRGNSDRLVLFQKDVKANEEDLINLSDDGVGITLNEIVDGFNENNFTINQIDVILSDLGAGVIGIVLYVDGANQYDITSLLSDSSNNPLNVSQFVNIKQRQTVIDPNQANEYLDTNIYELIPTGLTRQERIDFLFTELNTLLSGTIPVFDEDGDGAVDRDPMGNWTRDQLYYLDNSISATQESEQATIAEEDSFITRIRNNMNDLNEDKTLEDIYNTIYPYLTDIIEGDIPIEDERPEYQLESSGYLKFRNPNQGIIIRNTTQDYVEGLNPITQDYLETGFTITMWVRFLDKTSSGTLFNFGNPTRGENPFGFRLETYTLGRDEVTNITYDTADPIGEPDFRTWGEYAEEIALENNYFNKSDTERFVRLVIKDGDKLRDSHVGVLGRQKTTDVPGFALDSDYDLGLMSTTWIPEDFTEWYFIVATFNPDVEEDEHIVSGTGADGVNKEYTECLQVGETPDCGRTPYFWRNNIIDTGYTNHSNMGNKCKVEIISKTDLLRARGYKVD
ncbi:MAG: hypothetical protein CBC24_05060 [Candidatus Pelagibacter sp. TMED64]|nr:MAG: hypothetical protein CBC24_05060 [Candidatus Pelagibacter sp. TMED64]